MFVKSDSIQENLAVISDIHSNSYALSAVLEDIQKREISHIINLGDSLYGPIDPSGTYHMLHSSQMLSISGNQDRQILEFQNKDSGIPTLEFVKKELDHNAFEWLKELPFDLALGNDFYCCHGTPDNDEEYLLEEVNENGTTFRDTKEVEKKIAGIKQKVVLCGHSHVPGSVQLGEKQVINAGSVGLQAYDDDLPYFHIMQNHSPHARYVVLNYNSGRYSAEIVALKYDFERAAKISEMNGRKDWAQFLRTGTVKIY